ncbi:hypothetical protein JCM8208_006968 [Rhodotorula glutinis]
MASPSCVFKLYYDDGPSPSTRRYGYQGPLALEQVYTGLHERAAQVFHLPRTDIVLSVRDSLGNPSLTLDSFAAFTQHVCDPLAQHPEKAKIDDKKRVVLGFVVQSKAALERAERHKAASRQAAAAVSAAAATAAPVGTKRKADGYVEGDKVHPERLGPRGPREAVPSASAAVAEKGYAPSYVKPPFVLAEPHVPTTEAASQAIKRKSPSPESAPAPALELAESWTGVKALLGKFVRDLNSHLADTFGDEAAPFELREHSADPDVVEVKEDVKIEKAAAKDEATKVEDKKVVHYSVYCDCCMKTIVGSRFKCCACSNYDLCDQCVDARCDFHPAPHHFVEIDRPHASPVPSTRGALKREPKFKLDDEAKPDVVEKEVKPVVHSATCDVCNRTIVGSRFKCLQCADYDACAACKYERIDEVHPHHNFVRVDEPKHIQHRPQPDSRTVHRNIICDGCNQSPLVGVRYHCTHADCATDGGFDLCSACESLPIPIHPHDHNLLKIREPLNPFSPTGRTIVEQATQHAQDLVARAVDQGAERHGIVAALSSGPIASVLESLGVHVPVSSAPSAAAPAPVAPAVAAAASPKILSAELVDGPGEDKTLVVDVDVSQLPVERLQGLPAEIHVPVSLATQQTDEPVAAVEDVKAVQTNLDEQLAELQLNDVVEPESSDIETEGVDSENDESLPSGPAPVVQDDSPRAVFVADLTLLDGSVVPAGSEFHKVWTVRNSGTTSWPAGTRLVHVGGFSSKVAGGASRVKSFAVAVVAPGEVAEVQCECKAPDDSGRYMDFWRLSAPDGTRFGDRLWIDATVINEAESDLARSSCADGTSATANGSDGTMSGSHQSLSSSSFVAPSLTAAGKAASVPPSVASSSSSSAAHSPRIAPSSSGFSVPSHLAPSSVAGSEFESVQAGTASRAGSEGVYLSGDEDALSDEDESSDESSSESDSDLSTSSDEDDSEVEFVLVDRA